MPKGGEIVATDPNPYADGAARIPLRRVRLGERAIGARSRGVRVRISRSGDGVAIRLAAAPKRFKYLAYEVLDRPGRLVIDLWKAGAPRRPRAQRAGRVA